MRPAGETSVRALTVAIGTDRPGSARLRSAQAADVTVPRGLPMAREVLLRLAVRNYDRGRNVAAQIAERAQRREVRPSATGHRPGRTGCPRATARMVGRRRAKARGP